MTTAQLSRPSLAARTGRGVDTSDLDAMLVGGSAAMARIRAAIRMVAGSDASVLICGPSGSGKEVVARAIHALSPRNAKASVALNCGAIPRDLIESELFGHEKGAFTGALSHYKGRIEEADGGTLFLDEIGDMPADMQVRLLRVLEERRIARVGGRGSIPVNVRIVAATHRDIDAAIDAGSFREDLFYRLAVFPIVMPALADRVEDIPALVAHFLKAVPAARRVTLSPAACDRLSAHDWPGNVRELRNVVDRAVIIYGGGCISGAQMDSILYRRGRVSAAETAAIWAATDRLAELADAPEPVSGMARVDAPSVEPAAPLAAPTTRPAIPAPQDDPVDLGTLVADVERNFIADALTRAAGNVSEAARLLTLQRTTLIGKMQKYALVAG